jgi:hypothetical protein
VVSANSQWPVLAFSQSLQNEISFKLITMIYQYLLRPTYQQVECQSSLTWVVGYILFHLVTRRVIIELHYTSQGVWLL